MKPSALALLALTLPAHAAGNAPGPSQEGPYVEWVQVVDVFGPVDLMAHRPLCSLDTPCTGPSLVAPPMAPVPVPPAGMMLTAAIAAMIWRMKRWTI